MKRTLFFIGLMSVIGTLNAQSNFQLLEAARAFPPMPLEANGIGELNGSEAIVAAGAPYSDLEWTVFDTDYIDGETNGYDTFCPVDPSKEFPGADRVNLVECASKANTDVSYQGASGDRIILGSKRTGLPFFRKGPDRVDNDYLIIKHFDYQRGHIELPGNASDYRLLFATEQNQNVATTGTYLFYVANNDIDLIAFIFPCTEVPSDTTGQNADYWCNASQSLDLTNTAQFRFASAVSNSVSYSNGIAQVRAIGKEVIASTATDNSGNTYLFGLTDSNLNPSSTGENESLVVKLRPDGTTDWVFEYPTLNGTLFFDGTVGRDYVYAAGRTYGSLPGFRNKGRWDGIILKIDKNTGQLVDFTQYGQAGIDGFGNITVDNNGNLYVSGAGAPANSGLGDNVFLVAKYDADSLEQIWVSLDSATNTANRVHEAWGGITFVPAKNGQKSRLVVSGWFVNEPNAADSFVMVYSNLDRTAPTVLHTAIITSPGFSADWALANTVDANGNVYVAGYTSGNLQGGHKGEGDAFIVKYDSELKNPRFRQFGTSKSERFRKIEVDDANGTVYASGYTYGDFKGRNPDRSFLSGDIIVQKMDMNLNVLETAQIGTPYEERGYLTIKDDYVFVGGMTEGSLVSRNGGSFDAFLIGLNKSNLSVANVDANAITEEQPPVTMSDDIPNDQGITVYNVISPDADGRNDFLRIDGIEQYPDNVLRIYNKSGRLEHETKAYGINGNLFEGNGNQRNKQLKGTYIYTLEYMTANGKTKKSGYLVLL
ncbi:gliding motility-associated C-terminal domain-containing protein [Maribacter sp. 2-571]|uniref:gliding motility-associated C-terminal domain-containing protein n=1 Tax=Maribacter sp. 2-571 TaxID=3417569 RepID=UPI003D32ABDB